MPVIGQEAQKDEEQAEHDEERRRGDRLFVLLPSGPANATPARAHKKVALVGVAARPGWPAIAEEEARQEQKGPNQVVTERDRARQRSSEQQPEHDRDHNGPAPDGDDQQSEPAQRRNPHLVSAPPSNSQGAPGGARNRHAASSVGPICLHIDPPCVLARRPRSLARSARPLLGGALTKLPRLQPAGGPQPASCTRPRSAAS